MVATPAKPRQKHPPLAIGQRFGRWVVKRIVPPGNGAPTRAECVCDCGEVRLVPGANLKSRVSKSCGCFNQELARSRCGEKGSNFKHGLIHTRSYYEWVFIREHYAVDARWNDFRVFFADVGEAPKGCHLELINAATMYGPKKCKWVAGRRDSSRTRRFTVDGVSKYQSEWARELGVSKQVIDERIKLGWSVRAAVTTPKMSRSAATL